MSITTTTITRTNSGAYVSNGTLDADCSIARRMDGTTGLCIDGNLTITDEVKAAVLATLEDGANRVITSGQPTDNTAELDAYDAHHAAVIKAMEE